MTETTFAQFREWARVGTFVPVCREVMADLLTPVSAFLKVAEGADRAFLFESVVGGERLARYSFLGKDPFLVLRSSHGQTICERDTENEVMSAPFVDVLRDLMGRYRSPVVPGLPRFTGGAVGFLGYDTASWFEPTLERTRKAYPKGDNDTDDAVFMLFDSVLAFDHVKHRILLIANAAVDRESDVDLETCYESARAKVSTLEADLKRELPHTESVSVGKVSLRSNTTQQAFETAVNLAKDYIAAGDIFQVVLSQRFETEIEADPFTVYRALRYVNPSPYMYFMRLGGVSIVGSSPEMLVRVEGRHAETHPIAGTRPRGANEEEDAALAEELIKDEKERAEHVMLVDLGRNDLGRVSVYGSVQVSQYMALERYSHVMHLVSRVVGELNEENDRLDALVACFPAGTVSGAPKIRAMEIIEELESTARGIYAGAVGYVDFAGNLDCCITIRTIVLKGGRAYVQAGAGIVADSDPTTEYHETRAKALALIKALEMAESGLEPSSGGTKSGMA